MILRYVLPKMILSIAVGLLAGCNTASPPTVSEIKAQPSTTIETGKTATLEITAEGTDLQFEWTVEKGTLSNSSQSAVVYTAPDAPGADLVTVTVKTKGGEITRSISFEVVEPTPEPTATLPPTATESPTATPVPIACELRPTTQNLFPDLAGEEGQFPIYGPVEGANAENFHCEVVSDLVHNLPMAVHIKYEKVTNNSGWWGVATPNGYNAAKGHTQLCFWAYAKQPFQSFRIKMKDTSGKEDGVNYTLEPANEWKQICTDISKFEELGINTTQMDNVNLGFETTLGSAEIWVADFEFK